MKQELQQMKSVKWELPAKGALLLKKTLAFCLLLWVVYSLAAQTTLFTDNFQDGNYNGWSVVDEGTNSAPSVWNVTSGELVQSSNIYGPVVEATDHRLGTFLYYNQSQAFNWSNYSVEVTLRSTDNDGIGLMFYYKDPDNYYKIDLDSERNFRKLFKMVNGIETNLATSSGTYILDRNMTLNIKVINNTIFAALDGEDLFNGPVSDGSLTKGSIALYCWGDKNAIFDNVVVKDLPLLADAGTDQQLKDTSMDGWVSVRLNGSNSTGINGAIVSYQWYENNSLIASGERPLEKFPLGTHTVTLVVTDNQAHSASDTVQISVSSGTAFKIAILPDTQKYSQDYPDIFTSQTQWLKEHKATENIQFVFQEGDITNNNSTAQWNNAKASLSLLDGVIPYLLVPGNHDNGSGGSSNVRDTTLFNTAFPVSNFQNTPTWGGLFETGKLDNHYQLFSAGGTDWLVMGLEFGPGNSVLNWANNVMAAYPDRRVIVVSHTYMYNDETRHGNSPDHSWNPHSYGVADDPDGVNDGVEVWNKFVRSHANISFVFNGHILGDGLGRLVSTGDNGNKVYQILANFQMLPNGGNGFLRLVEIDPLLSKVSVKTYSPYLNQYMRDEGNQFEYVNVDLSPPQPPRVLYEDTFADGNFNGWTIVDEGTVSAPSAWQVSSGRLVQSSNIYGPDAAATANRKGTFVYYNNTSAFSWTDYSFNATLKATDDDGIGVMFRYKNRNNYYKLDMDRQRAFQKLFKVVNGVETVIASNTTAYPSNSNMNLNVQVAGNSITCTLDGITLFGGPVTDNSHASGTVALYCWGEKDALFDNVGVHDLTPVLLSASFAASLDPYWVSVDEGTIDAPSAWQVTGGKLAESSNIYGPDRYATSGREGTFLYYNHPAAFAWSNYRIDVTLRSSDNDGIGVMFYYRDANNYYKLDLDKERNFRKLFKVADGVETTIANVAGGYSLNTDMDLCIKILNGTFSFFLDGQNIFGGPVTDSDLISGTIALYSWGNAGSFFDDVTVTDYQNKDSYNMDRE